MCHIILSSCLIEFEVLPLSMMSCMKYRAILEKDFTTHCVELSQLYLSNCRSEEKIRHYMIDLTRSQKFNIVGEPKVHRSLHELVHFYQTVSWNLAAHCLHTFKLEQKWPPIPYPPHDILEAISLMIMKSFVF